MFGRRKWKNSVLVEGEKEATLVAREENLPGVSPEFDQYPVDIALPRRRNLWQAIKKSMTYSKMGIYNMFYKT